MRSTQLKVHFAWLRFIVIFFPPIYIPYEREHVNVYPWGINTHMLTRGQRITQICVTHSSLSAQLTMTERLHPSLMQLRSYIESLRWNERTLLASFFFFFWLSLRMIKMHRRTGADRTRLPLSRSDFPKKMGGHKESNCLPISDRKVMTAMRRSRNKVRKAVEKWKGKVVIK